MSERVASWFEATRAWADERLVAWLDRVELGPPALEEALRYALLGGGKRVRPALVRAVGEACSDGDDEALERAAVAVECIHTYSLVHDDLPCMDDDDLRRGRATVHVRFDEATAVLVGDALQTLAFELLAGARGGAEMVLVLARASGAAGMVGGQVLDLASEGRALGADEVDAIHATKTAALLGASSELGAIAAGASGPSRAAARSYGRAIGRCFQALDDILDVTEDASQLGKTPGKDREAQKGTLVAALGLEGARDAARRYADEARSHAVEGALGPHALGLVDLLLDRRS